MKDLFIDNEVKTVTQIKTDTLIRYISVPPITIKGKTSYKKVIYIDSSYKQQADSLLLVNRKLMNDLAKMQVREYANLDTIINKDTVNASYELFTSQWYINLRLAQRPVKTEIQTITIEKTITGNEKYYYGLSGFGLGLLIGILK